MKLRLAQWGKNLAIKLPTEYIRATGLQDGDSVEVEITFTDRLKLTPTRPFNKRAFMRRIRKLRASMKMTEPVVEKMRQESPY